MKIFLNKYNYEIIFNIITNIPEKFDFMNYDFSKNNLL